LKNSKIVTREGQHIFHSPLIMNSLLSWYQQIFIIKSRC